MTSGLLVPLSQQQQVALRRIALRAPTVDAAVASQLVRLALVERTGRDLRLTPLGQLRYEALPKAPLLTRQRSVHALTSYVEGLIEKAQHRAEVPCGEDSEPADLTCLSRQILMMFDVQHFKARACRSMEKVRRKMMEHHKSHAELCASSRLQISRSRSLLERSMPIRPR